MSKTLVAGLVLSILSQCSLAISVHVPDVDFPDPAVIQTDDGYYAFATASASKGIKAQVASSPDFKTWKLLDSHDALPGPFPDWIADKPEIWVPDVIKRV